MSLCMGEDFLLLWTATIPTFYWQMHRSKYCQLFNVSYSRSLVFLMTPQVLHTLVSGSWIFFVHSRIVCPDFCVTFFLNQITSGGEKSLRLDHVITPRAKSLDIGFKNVMACKLKAESVSQFFATFTHGLSYLFIPYKRT